MSRHKLLVCTTCPPARRTQFSAPGEENDICDIHGWTEAVEMVPVAVVSEVIDAWEQWLEYLASAGLQLHGNAAFGAAMGRLRSEVA